MSEATFPEVCPWTFRGVPDLPNPGRFLPRPLGSYRLKGKDTPVVITDVMVEDDGSSFVRPLKEEIAHVGEALHGLQAGDFAAAIHGFAALVAHIGHVTRALGPIPRRHGCRRS